MKCIYTWHRFYVEFGLIDLSPSLQYRDLCLCSCYLSYDMLDEMFSSWPRKNNKKKDQYFLGKVTWILCLLLLYRHFQKSSAAGLPRSLWQDGNFLSLLIPVLLDLTMFSSFRGILQEFRMQINCPKNWCGINTVISHVYGVISNNLVLAINA